MERVYGPYPDKDVRGTITGYRIVIVEGPGRGARRRTVGYATEQEARSAKAEVESKAGLKLIGSTIDEWLLELQTTGEASAKTCSTYRYRLLGGKRPVGMLGSVQQIAVKDLVPNKAQRLYEDYMTGHSPDTHQGALTTAKAFYEWCRREKKLITTNPWVDVLPRGRKNTRKQQHRFDDAQRLFDYLVPRAMDLDGELAVLIALVLGFRAHEVVGITARDLDRKGTVLWAAGTFKGKTKNATRPLKLPEILQGPLRKRAMERTGRLLPYKTGYVRANTIRCCIAAGVPPICAQALRGMYATIGLEEGETPDVVARSLGQGSSKVTKGSYALEGSGKSAEVNTVMRRLLERLQQ